MYVCMYPLKAPLTLGSHLARLSLVENHAHDLLREDFELGLFLSGPRATAVAHLSRIRITARTRIRTRIAHRRSRWEARRQGKRPEGCETGQRLAVVDGLGGAGKVKGRAVGVRVDRDRSEEGRGSEGRAGQAKGRKAETTLGGKKEEPRRSHGGFRTVIVCC